MSWKFCDKEISAEDYKAVKSGEKGEYDLFTDAEIIGYGVIPSRMYEKDGKYFIRYGISDSCD